MAYEVTQKLKEINEQPFKIEAAFHDLNNTIQTNVDELSKDNAQLENTLARLEGKPENGLATALADARIEADKLYESLSKDDEKLQKIVKENKPGFFGRAVMGVQGTGDIEDWLSKYEQTVKSVNYAGSQNVHNAKNPADVKTAQDEWDKALAEMRREAQKRLDVWTKEAQAPRKNRGMLDGGDDEYERNRAARIQTLEGLREEIGLEGDLVTVQQKNADVKGKVADLGAKDKAARRDADLASVQERQIDNEKKIATTRIEIYENVVKQRRQIGETSIEQETASLLNAENARYQIELDAANRINALKEKVAAAEHRPADTIDTGVLEAEHQKRMGDLKNRGAEEQKKYDDEQLNELNRYYERVVKEGQSAGERGLAAIERLHEQEIKDAERTASEARKTARDRTRESGLRAGEGTHRRRLQEPRNQRAQADRAFEGHRASEVQR